MARTAAGEPEPVAALRRRGRPREAATDARILRALVELVTEIGVARTTLSAVARRAGVARATVYLRWPTRSALLGAAARAAVGGNPMTLTGDIERDIRAASTFIQGAFAGPILPAVMPEIVRGVLARPPELSFDLVVPRRRDFAAAYSEKAAAAGFDPDVDPYLAVDLLLGASIAFLLANGRAMTVAGATRLADVVIRGLRTTAGGQQTARPHEASGPNPRVIRGRRRPRA